MPQEPESLLSDFPRGDPARTADQFTPPDAQFAKETLLRRPLRTWQPGKIFLGVAGGDVLADDAGRAFVMGGHPVGLDDDRHIMGWVEDMPGNHPQAG